MTVEFYASATGNNPVWEFIQDLDESDKKYIYRALTRCHTAHISYLFSSGTLKKVGKYLYEIRVSANGKAYRILCAIKGAVIWLLHAFQKKSQDIKQKHINSALERLVNLDLQLKFANI